MFNEVAASLFAHGEDWRRNSAISCIPKHILSVSISLQVKRFLGVEGLVLLTEIVAMNIGEENQLQSDNS
ncbi:hypothetical protein L6164_001999 [Bauhinia variegata]|uniref:Uncharacterized protein n=1 Tax=Bauhinia variegata TaxID=167791 RepID=A0ACB9PWW4_BAUVA|nr:hypothetical protein L6164_001999 [Bauhinia variegata]